MSVEEFQREETPKKRRAMSPDAKKEEHSTGQVRRQETLRASRCDVGGAAAQ